MMLYDIYDTAWIFFIYSFIGWCLEVILYAVVEGKFVNRGFLNGALCPIYGIGVLIVITVLNDVKDNIVLLFFASVLLTSILELLVGFILDKLFKKRWWDYSNEPMNLGGYVCLRFSLMWGIGCIVVVDLVHPLILQGIDLIPHGLGIVLLMMLLAVLFYDLVYTLLVIKKFNRGIIQLEEIARNIKKISDRIGGVVADGAITIMEKGELREKYGRLKGASEYIQDQFKGINETSKEEMSKKLADLKKAQKDLAQKFADENKRLLSAFPTMSSVKYKESIEKIKETFRENRKSKGKK